MTDQITDDQLTHEEQLLDAQPLPDVLNTEGDGYSIEIRPQTVFVSASWAGQLQYREFGEHRRGPSRHEQ